jgi:hypothetical protein
LLVIASAFDWDTKLTTKANWLGGYRSSAEPVRGMDTVEELLKENFTRKDIEAVIPSVLRINRRKSVLKEVMVTVWQKI